MLDMKVLRNEPEKVKRAFLKRKENFDLDGLFELDDLRKQLIFENEQKKAQQNTVSKQIPTLKKEGKDTTEVFAEMKKGAAAMNGSPAEECFCAPRITPSRRRRQRRR